MSVAYDEQVPLDCLIFDKVLLFLEAAALGRDFDFDINQVDEMAAAAAALGCQPLLDVCHQKTGAFEARLREYLSPEESVTASKKNTENGIFDCGFTCIS